MQGFGLDCFERSFFAVLEVLSPLLWRQVRSTKTAVEWLSGRVAMRARQRAIAAVKLKRKGQAELVC